MSFLEPMLDNLLVEGSQDSVEAFEVALLAVEIGGATSDDEIRDASLGIIREALTLELVCVGDVGEGGFQPWAGDLEAAMARIELEWRALKREPSIGEICRFKNTPAGTERAENCMARSAKRST
jgi:hypothetical protein